MDPINLLPADGVEVVHQNGVHDEPSNSGEDGGAPYDLDPSVTETAETVASNGNFDNFHQSDSAAIDNSFVAEIKESNDIIDGNNVIIITKVRGFCVPWVAFSKLFILSESHIFAQF